MKKALKMIGLLITMACTTGITSAFIPVECDWFDSTASNCWTDFARNADRCIWDDFGTFNKSLDQCHYIDSHATFGQSISFTEKSLKSIKEFSIYRDGKLCISYKDSGDTFVATSSGENFTMKVEPLSETLEIQCPDGLKYTIPYKRYLECSPKSKPGLSFVIHEEGVSMGLKGGHSISCRRPASHSE